MSLFQIIKTTWQAVHLAKSLSPGSCFCFFSLSWGPESWEKRGKEAWLDYRTPGPDDTVDPRLPAMSHQL